MSEADNVWRVSAGQTEHEIEIQHSTMTGKIVVLLDGAIVGEDRMLARRTDVAFDLDGEPAEVSVHFAYAGFGARSTLHVARRYVEPLAK